jgi:hypothetical protein
VATVTSGSKATGDKRLVGRVLTRRSSNHGGLKPALLAAPAGAIYAKETATQPPPCLRAVIAARLKTTSIIKLHLGDRRDAAESKNRNSRVVPLSDPIPLSDLGSGVTTSPPHGTLSEPTGRYVAVVLLILAICAGVGGFVQIMQGQNVLREWVGLVLIVVSAVLLSGASIVNSIDRAEAHILWKPGKARGRSQTDDTAS